MKEEDFKEKKGDSECGGKMVIVVVKASSRGVPRSALVWALNHIVQPGDCIKLLVLIPSHPSSSTWIKGFTVFTRDCTPTHPSTLSGTLADQKDDIEHTSSQMVLQLHDLYDPQKVKVRIKVVPRSQQGVVASEVKKAQSNWVIFDKDLKHERKHCMAELQCNVVVMKRSQAKVLRLNLVNNNNDNQLKEMGTQVGSLLSTSESEKAFPKCLRTYFEESTIIAKGPVVTPASSPDQESPLTVTDLGASSISSSDMGTYSLVSGSFPGRKEDFGTRNSPESDSDRVSDKKPCPSTKTSYFLKWMADSISSSRVDLSKNLYRPSKLGLEPQNVDLGLSRKVRETISLSQKAPLRPPPLCSICQHKAPVFGNPPRWFTYSELELATGGFSGANFLAEGGFGSVHRGVLLNGQVVAVKQYKLASSQGDREFCSEVEVLSCAQHRNVVMLIGFCVEAGKRLLVYEYICNGSLHSHLYGKNNGDALEWTARQKIAVGATRGLRYLHEECRVGCIVHRDMRPNNILLTHDFEPLVGDFGLARWQPDGDMGVETRILGTFGYLAPEYAQSGQITEKADVYSFGVVLLELVTGRKAIDINRPKGQQCLTEWARTLLRKGSIAELVDPRLGNCYSVEEVHRMLRCASLCIKQDPYSRPRMSQVLRILEGDIAM